MAEEVDGVGDKVSGDTTTQLLEAFLSVILSSAYLIDKSIFW